MRRCKVGVQLEPQHTTMDALLGAARDIEAMGVDSLWTWDHFYPLSGPEDGAHFEGWTLLTAMAAVTERVQVGHLVSCNSYRNPELLADMARTVDHVSAGRTVLGIGSGWFERDYDAYGYDFGTAIGRLEDLGEALPRIRERIAALTPPPVGDLPILIGGGGEKVTLRLVARYADMWNGFGPPDTYEHKNRVLDEWCDKEGRDPADIERTVMISRPDQVDDLDAFLAAGAQHVMLGLGEPFELGLLERLLEAAGA